MGMDFYYWLQSLPLEGLPRAKPARSRHYAHDPQQLGPSSRAVPPGAGNLWWQWASVLELGPGAYSMDQMKGTQKIKI